MPAAPPLLPDWPTLADRLAAVLGGDCSPPRPVAILARAPNPYSSTSPSEVVTCRLPDGGVRRVLCKYSTGSSGHAAHGHRGGVAYEADVYRHVLRPLEGAGPPYYGTFGGGSAGPLALVLGFLDGASWVHKAPDGAAMRRAARWIGRFHARNQGRLATAPAPPLNRYTAAYYRGWARRTWRFAAPWRGRWPWLGRVCERFEHDPGPLVESPPTIIHGEYYPENVLYRAGAIYPVDWESAAIGPGAIDLAALTDDWPAEVIRACESEYRRARWPEGPPADSERTLPLARLYLLFRWLGDRPQWTRHEGALRTFERLRAAAEHLGWI